MPDFRAAVPWVEDRVDEDMNPILDQLMTARWENRIVANTHALYAQAYAGGQAFRSVTMRVPYLRSAHSAIAAAIPAVVWNGWYRHTNKYISGVYTIHRATAGIAIDNAEDPFDPGTFFDPVHVDRWYVEDTGISSQAGVQIKADDDDPDDENDWTDIRDDTHSASSDLDVVFQNDISALALTEGVIYRVRVWAKNCAITVARLWAEGALDTYSALPAVEDGFVLAPAQWNTFIESQAYCRGLTAAPAAGFSGIYNRRGNDQDTTFTASPFVGRIRHTGPTLRYRIGVAGSSGEQAGETDWPADWTADGVARLMALPAGGPAIFIDGTNEVYPVAAGLWNPAATPNEFATGARIRILKYSAEDSYLNWRWVEGEWTVDGAIAVGDWYDVYMETASNHTNQPFRVRVDLLAELVTEGDDDLAAEGFSANDYVRGDTVGAVPTWQKVVDDMALVKAACDTVIQVLTPDTSRALARDMPSPHMFVRQRPWLYWAGGDASNLITLAVGTPTAYKTVDLGYSSGGLLDLTSIAGLDVGTTYWLSPWSQVEYAFEGFAE